MNIKIIMQALLFCNFSLLHSMEFITEQSSLEEITTQKDILENIMKISNKYICRHWPSADIVSFVTQMQKHNVSFSHATIDKLFLAYATDNDIRPLMLSLGANINATTEEGRNCLWKLMKAKRINTEDQVKFDTKTLNELINKGIIVDIQDINGKTPFHEFFSPYHVKNGVQAARIILKHSKNLHMHVHNSEDLWYEAVTKKSDSTCLEAAQLLCEYKVYPNIKGKIETPLMSAIKRNMIELIKLVLDHGANPNRLSNHYYPLYVAMEKERSYRLHRPLMYDDHTKAVITLLLQHGADPNIKQYEEPLLHLIITYSPDISTALGLIHLLFEYKVDVNLQDYGKKTALWVAEKLNKPELVQELLKHGAVKEIGKIEEVIATFYIVDEKEKEKPSITKQQSFINKQFIIKEEYTGSV